MNLSASGPAFIPGGSMIGVMSSGMPMPPPIPPGGCGWPMGPIGPIAIPPGPPAPPPPPPPPAPIGPMDMGPPVEECCAEKMVGSVSYTLAEAPFRGAIPHQCLNDCVYTVTGTSSPKFCFQRGSYSFHSMLFSVAFDKTSLYPSDPIYNPQAISQPSA